MVTVLTRLAVRGALIGTLTSALAQPVDLKTCGVSLGANLLVFVGKKVSLESAVAGANSLDLAFHAKYQVVKVFCGDYSGPTLEFDAYDHYGEPAFSDYDSVLLYVSSVEGRYVHQKYQFQPIYETAAGDWAGCGDPYLTERPFVGDVPDRSRTVKAGQVRFKSPPRFPVGQLSEEGIEARFPSEYFIRKADSVECVAGASIDGLFAVKRNGVLRARGLFQ